MPKVSVVLPSYNGEQYIRESIDSVLAQSLIDIELILVDDCSSDSTPQIMEEYAQKDKRVHVIHNTTNRKLPESLNIGFRLAEGKYVTWTSDDNCYYNYAIEKMASVLDNNKSCMFVYANMEIINATGEIIQQEFFQKDDDVLVSNCIGACFLYRHEVIDEIGEYSKEFFLVEDYEYWLRIKVHYGLLYCINEVLYRYRRHSQSLSAEKFLQVRKALCRLRQFYWQDLKSQIMSNEKSAFHIFHDNYLWGNKENEICKDIKERYPFAMKIGSEKENDSKIVFGAGELGEKWIEKHPDVEYIIDNNPVKQGTFQKNILICSVDKLQTDKQSICVVLAVSEEKQLDIIHQLLKYNVSIELVY